MSVSDAVLGALLPLSVAATLLLRATTCYLVEPDRLLIRRIWFTWMEIPFRDVEEIESPSGFLLDRFLQVRLYQLGFRRIVRITKRKGIRYVLINPVDPVPIVDALRRYKASHWSEPPVLSKQPLPDFLRRR